MSKHSVPASDVFGLLRRFAELRHKAAARTGWDFPIIGIIIRWHAPPSGRSSARPFKSPLCGNHLPHAAPVGCQPGLIAFISLMMRFQRTRAGSPSQVSHSGAIIICCFSPLRGFLSGKLKVAFT
jgi:hypothetical protein